MRPAAAALVALALVARAGGAPMGKAERRALREDVRALFSHGYDHYMAHAFPHDSLQPLSCRGEDNWGGISMTLLDTLDTLETLAQREHPAVAGALGTAAA